MCKRTFCDISFEICVLIVCICALILTISRRNLCELDQITKNTKFSKIKSINSNQNQFSKIESINSNQNQFPKIYFSQIAKNTIWYIHMYVHTLHVRTHTTKVHTLHMYTHTLPVQGARSKSAFSYVQVRTRTSNRLVTQF